MMKPYQNLSLEDMPGEVWKDIPGWEGRYQVSNKGRVKSLISGNRIRKQHKNPEGYMRITLVRGGLFPAFAVHRLVAIAFIPNPECKPVIDHINGEREDNRVENLRWTTVLENANNPVTMKRRLGRSSPMKGRKGPECPLSKPCTLQSGRLRSASRGTLLLSARFG